VAEPIQFYFDEHIYEAVAHGLRLHGVDVLTAHEAGRRGLPDPDQLQFATAQQRVMVTFDTDYLMLHQSGMQHAGIAWCPATSHSIGQLIQALLLLHGVLDRDTMQNHLEYLSPPTSSD
jgi:predicted nuclease of predicted toxin-antitoxin system